MWSEVREAGVKDTSHLGDERLHVEPVTFRQGGTKQVFCSGNLWGRVKRKDLPYLSIFSFLTHKHERFEAKENVSLFALAVNVKNEKKRCVSLAASLS